MPEKFSAEAHFESKLKQGSIRDQGSVLRFGAMPLEPKKFHSEKGLRRIAKDRFKYEDFKTINQMHTGYLRELQGNLPPKAFLDTLYRAELTGALIQIAGKEGIVVEERRNSLSVIFEGNVIKIYPKKVWDFRLIFDGVQYLFFSEALKKGRSLKR